MNKERINKVIDNLDEINVLSQDIESNIHKINEITLDLPISTIDSFKIYTEPQQNIQEINKFYRLFIYVIEENNKHTVHGKKDHVESIDNYYNTKNTLKDLDEYIEIKIVQRYVSKTLKTLQTIVEPLNSIFFNNFGDYVKDSDNDKFTKQANENVDIQTSEKAEELHEKKQNTVLTSQEPEKQKDATSVSQKSKDTLEHMRKEKKYETNDKNELIKIAHFLEQEDTKNFIEQFCKTLINKYKCKQNSEFIEHLRLLNDDFAEIKDVCKTMLNEKHAEIVNLEVKQMIVVDAKNILSRILLNYENKYKNENLYSCCKLYSYINKDEVKQYFVEFFDNITKIIHNLLLTFFYKIDEIKKPNKDHKSEEIIVLTYKIIKCFENNCYTEFFVKHRSSLKYKNYEQLKTFSGKTLTEKMYKLSKTLKGIQKNVYILNNLYVLQFFYKIHDGVPLVERIENHSNEIIAIWESELKKRKESEFTKFLDVNLEIQQEFYLPEEIRINIVEKIKESVLETCKEKTYKKGEDVLKMKINKLFDGSLS